MRHCARSFLPLVLLAAAAAAAPAAAPAQVAAYLTFNPIHASTVQTGSVYTAGTGYGNRTTGFWAAGIGGGVTLNLLHIGPASLGLDLRGSTRPGTDGIDTGLAGVKFGFNPPALRLKPYVQAFLGYVATRTTNVSTGVPPGSTLGNQYFAYEILGGLDYPLIPLLDLRVIEIGAGQGFPILSNTNAGFLTLNTGLVLHF